MTQTGKLLVVAGLLLVAVGSVIWLAGRAGFRGLPGDIRVEREQFSFYFPVVTCIVLSVVLTGSAWLVTWLIRWWRQ